jgi:type II secretory pathway pseudopilin PulG
MRRDRHGITLVEVAIVVTVTAFMTVVIALVFLESQKRARVARTKSEMRTLATAIEAYYVDWSIYPGCGIGRFGTRGFRTFNSDVARRTGNLSGVADLPSFSICDFPAPDKGFLTLTTGVSFIGWSKGPRQRQLFPYTPYIPAYPVDPFCADRGATFVYWGVFPGAKWTARLYGGYETYFGGVRRTAVGGVGWIKVSPGPDGNYDLAGCYYAYSPAVSQPSAPLLFGTNPKGSAFTYDPTNGLVSDGDIWRVKM